MNKVINEFLSKLDAGEVKPAYYFSKEKEQYMAEKRQRGLKKARQNSRKLVTK
jgi:hypothetical protein